MGDVRGLINGDCGRYYLDENTNRGSGECEELRAELRELEQTWAPPGLNEAYTRPANVCLQPDLLQYFLLLSMGLCISTSHRQSTGRINQGAFSGDSNVESPSMSSQPYV